MTPKEKAQDLFMSSFCLVQTTDKYGYLLKDEEKNISIKIAKNTVEEIINEVINRKVPIYNYDKAMDYWEEVKEELDKL